MKDKLKVETLGAAVSSIIQSVEKSVENLVEKGFEPDGRTISDLKVRAYNNIRDKMEEIEK